MNNETQNSKRNTQHLVWGAVMLVMAGIGGSAFAQNVQAKMTQTKSSDELRRVFMQIAARGNQSTVSVRAQRETGTDREQVAFGTVVGTEGNDGYVLTKASEVAGRKDVKVAVGDRELAATVVGVSEPLDLAMLRVVAGKESGDVEGGGVGRSERWEGGGRGVGGDVRSGGDGEGGAGGGGGGERGAAGGFRGKADFWE